MSLYWPNIWGWIEFTDSHSIDFDLKLRSSEKSGEEEELLADKSLQNIKNENIINITN